MLEAGAGVDREGGLARRTREPEDRRRRPRRAVEQPGDGLLAEHERLEQLPRHAPCDVLLEHAAGRGQHAHPALARPARRRAPEARSCPDPASPSATTTTPAPPAAPSSAAASCARSPSRSRSCCPRIVLVREPNRPRARRQELGRAPVRSSPARSRRSRSAAWSSGDGSHCSSSRRRAAPPGPRARVPLLELGQLLERAQAEQLQEQRGGAVEHGAERRAAGLLDQAALGERARGGLRRDAADARHLRPRDRLQVGDHRQRLGLGRRERRRARASRAAAARPPPPRGARRASSRRRSPSARRRGRAGRRAARSARRAPPTRPAAVASRRSSSETGSGERNSSASTILASGVMTPAP